MKTITQLLLLVAFICEDRAQDFYPFPDSNCVWSVSALKYFIKDDTIINNLKYQKYFYTADSTLLSGHTFCGLLRNDSAQKKIYFRGGFNPNTEKLLYNYNFSLNDTLPPFTLAYNQTYNALIDGVDSVLVLGSYRKKWLIRAIYPDFGTAQWIEGVGCNNGPIRSGFEWWNTFDYVDFDLLLCQHINGVLAYTLGWKFGCYYLPVSIHEYDKDAKVISLFPNPAQDRLTIEFAQEMRTSGKSYHYVICDLMGLTLISFSESRKTFDVPVGELSPGIYLLELKSENKSLSRKKFVKE